MSKSCQQHDSHLELHERVEDEHNIIISIFHSKCICGNTDLAGMG